MELRKLTPNRGIDKLINSRKIVIACLELVSPIFLFSYFLYIGFPWPFIIFMITLHIFCLYLAVKDKQRKLGYILGTVFNSIYLIMIIGFFIYLHTNDFNTTQYPAGEEEFRTGIFNFMLVLFAGTLNTITALALLLQVKKS
ncbi:hypothetical protein [Bacillus suaedaesalsae]|uniref:Uncharacterized protein n=1 Tax=Bacillus suaedaesalsae TaxID=2810349 RepID=A0ABS2DE21_9BACI|nr:hypothetical protein [Bacillus suaedaesalsae]MBM6616705.1 hypothetical protein [Bacillus suaedaesalsae]